MSQDDVIRYVDDIIGRTEMYLAQLRARRNSWIDQVPNSKPRIMKNYAEKCSLRILIDSIDPFHRL